MCVEYSRVGGDLLLRRTAAHERWRRSGFSLTASVIWLSLSLTAPSNYCWFLSHCYGDLALSLTAHCMVSLSLLRRKISDSHLRLECLFCRL
ncbi:hypothetical protein L6452_13579 [Arctium lappa]|uniref:Uncharacterized protein n=1 Tax=Arctium lappa TaxID=4217 RepID=A0ACB9CIK6_ARCLA|nr:hypothetical protein L6452_13579 [Arctium lappa]